MGKYASKVVELAQSWVGIKEGSKEHQSILDIYNSQRPLPRGYKMTTKDAWCAATATALAVKLGYTDIIPCECSCNRMISIAKDMGIWIEDESVTPQPGWFLLYDWQDNGIGDCKGDAEHIGVVEKVEGGRITMIEGNYDGPDADKTDGVERRTPFSVGARYIRGYIAPKYDPEPAQTAKPAQPATAVVKLVTVNLPQLRKGDEGKEVQALQRLLSTYGYNLGSNNPFDGKFGALTETAVEQFQEANGLAADGVVGLKTWSCLLGVK